MAAPLAREIAAVLACGEGAVLSHRNAGELWRLLPASGHAGAVEVTVAGRNSRAKPGIRVHRVNALDRLDVRVRHAVPITSPARTLLDLAAHAGGAELEQALGEAYARRLIRRADLAGVLARHPRHRGTGALRELVEAEAPPARLRSQAERRLLELVRRGRLPRPEPGMLVGR